MSGRTARANRRADTARTAALDAAIEAVWAEVPDAGCKGLCQDCCGPIGMSEAERDRIRRRHGITIRDAETKPGTLDCPALGDDGRCQVYADRPAVCRAWGAVEPLPCPHGCVPVGGRLSDEDAAAVMRAAMTLDDPDHPLTDAAIRRVATDSTVGPLLAAAMRGDRSVYPALAAAAQDLIGSHR